MSKTIDERVVSMQFDNKQFEANVKTTMGTLGRLKQSLNLNGAAKGLENIGTAAKKVDFNPMASGVESVRLKFSALEVMAVTALSRITNSAITAGKHLVSAFTIAPIKSGFQEYETQINAVQTILSNTKSKGSTLDDVNRTLDELNTYADKTIYNFTEMTRNIGTFTAAGIGLEDSAKSIQGIANLAAMSGSNAQQASTAMYQLSQAMASGTVKLMDWNSVVNAGMGGQLFQDALKETARMHGIAVDAMIEEQGSFRESLSEGWISAEILTETLSKMTQSGAAEYLSDLTGITQEEIAATQKLVDENKNGTASYEELAQKMAETGAITKEQAINILEMADEATNAATKVKTFTQLMDTLKEAVQSGWTQTWEILIGDFNEAKELWTGLSDFFGGIIGKSAESRNAVLEGAMTSGWDKLKKSINEAGLSTDDFLDRIKNVVKEHGGSVEKLIDEYGSLEKAIKAGAVGSDLLKKALGGITESMADLSLIKDDLKIGETGDDIKQAQAALKELGYDLGKFGEQADGIDGVFGSVTQSAVKAFQAANNLKVTGIVDEATLAALKEATTTSKELEGNFDDLIDSVTVLGGREMLIESFKNAWRGLTEIFTEIKNAWQEVFPPKSIEERTAKLHGIIEAIYKFSKGLTINEETADNLRRTFEGLFSILDIVSKITSGVFGLGFRLLSKVFSSLNLNILDVTAAIGDAITAFDKMFFRNETVDAVMNNMADGIAKACVYLRDFAVELWKLPIVQDAIAGLSKWFQNLGVSMGEYFSGGLKKINEFIERVKTIDSFSMENLGKIFEDFRDNVLEYFLGFDLSFDGFMGKISEVRSKLEGWFNTCVSYFSNFRTNVEETFSALGDKFTWIKDKILSVTDFLIKNIPAIIAVVMGSFLIGAIKKLADAFSILAAPIESFNSLMTTFEKSLKKVAGALAFKVRAEGVKSIAISIGILAASLFVLSKVDQGALWSSVGAISVLMVVLGGLAFAIGKMGSLGDTGKIMGTLLGISAAMAILGYAMKNVSGIDADGLDTAIKAMSYLVIISMMLMGVSKVYSIADAAQVGTMMLGIGASMILLTHVMKIISGMSGGDIFKGIAVITAFELLAMGLVAVSKLSGEHASKAGSMILKIGVAMMLMVGVVKLVAGVSASDIAKGIAVMSAFEILAMGLVAVSYLAGPNASRAGSMILKISIAMLGMTTVIKMVAGVSVSDIEKGIKVMAAFELLAMGLVAVSYLAGPNAAKAGAMILMISGAMLMLTGVIWLLQNINIEGLAKGLIAVTVIGLVFSELIKATEDAKDCMASLIVLTVAVTALGILIAALSICGATDVMAAAASLSTVIFVFSLLVKALDSLKDVKAFKSIGILVTMTGCIILLGYVIKELSAINPENAIGSALSLSILCIALSVTLRILGGIGTDATGALTGVLALTAMWLPLFAFVDILTRMQSVESAMSNVTAMSTLVGVLTLALIPLTIIGNFAIPAAAGIIALTAMWIPLVAFVDILTRMQNIQNAEANANLLTSMLAAIAGVLIKVSIIAPLAVVGVAALNGLTGLMVVLGALAIGIGALTDKFPVLEGFVDTGIPILIKVANGIGQMIGAFVSGIAIGLMAILPGLAVNLSMFMVAIQPFLIGARMIDGEVLTGVGYLTGAILALAVGEFITGILTLGGAGLVGLGVQLSAFILAATPFLLVMSTLDPKILEGAKTLSDMILSLTAADLLSGITSFITGEASFESFATSLSTLGEGIKSFAESISGLTEADIAQFQIVADAGSALATLAEAIPSTGGWLQKIMGYKDLGGFGEGLSAFATAIIDCATALNTYELSQSDIDRIGLAAKAGTAMSELANSIPALGGKAQTWFGAQDLSVFGETLKTFAGCIIDCVTALNTYEFSEEDVTRIKNAAKAGTAMSELANSLPEQGGIAQKLMGSQDLSTFGTSLTAFGTGVSSFANSVKGITDESIVSIAKSGEAVDAIKEVAQKVPTSGGWGEAIFGSKDGGSFGAAASSLGNGIKTYVNAVSGIGDEQIASIKNSKKAVDAMADVSKKIPTDSSHFENAAPFISGMSSLARNLKTYISSASSIGDEQIASIKKSEESVKALSKAADAFSKLGGKKIGNAASNISQLSAAISGLSSMNFSGVNSLGTALKGMAQSGINDFAKEFSGAGANKARAVVTSFATSLAKSISSKNSAFTKAGVDMMNSFIKGLKSKSSQIRTSFTAPISSAASGVRAYYSSFYSAGASLVSGFAAGISANTYMATAKARAMANAAAAAARAALNINSPSRVFREIGKGVPEGFALGIGLLGSVVKKSVVGMADNAIDGTRNAIASIADAINSDIDTQPTIRPVLDLDNIRSGAGAISGMFNMKPSVGVMSNVGAISMMMNRNRQNGVNDDVISAIKDLGRNIANAPNTNYNINGITYSDGSDISDAVRVLVRAARVERRV